MTVVSNAGPLIALGKLGRLDILQSLYQTVIVPQQVYDETVTTGIALGAPDAQLISEYFKRGGRNESYASFAGRDVHPILR